MQSCAWINGQQQHVGPASQSSEGTTQSSLSTVVMQQAGTAQNSCQYTGARLPQSSYFTFQNGANRQMSNWQTSLRDPPPYPKVSPQQPSGENNSKYYRKVLLSDLQDSSTNTQTGNLASLVTNGFQAASQFHPLFTDNSPTQTSPNMMNANTIYSRQDMSSHWKQPVTVHGQQPVRMQNDAAVSDLQHYRAQKIRYQTANGDALKPVSACIVSGAPLLNMEQTVFTSTPMSAAAHNRQTAHSQNHGQNGTQLGFSFYSPPSSVAVFQSFANKNIITNSKLSGQVLHVSSAGKKTRQYSAQLSSAHNNGGMATSSFTSNSFNCQYETGRFLLKTNELPQNPSADESQMTRTVSSLHNSYTAAADSVPVSASSPFKGQHFVSGVQMTESCQPMQPVSLTAYGNYNSNTTQQLPLYSGQSLPKTMQSVISGAQHTANAPRLQSSVPADYVSAKRDGIGNVEKAGDASSTGNVVGSSSDASQLMQLPESISPQSNKTQLPAANSVEMLEILPSVKQMNSSIHSSPGRTGTRAVAVVQPLSQESYEAENKHTSSNATSQSDEFTMTNKSLNNAEKMHLVLSKNTEGAYLKEGFNLYPENTNQMRSNKVVNKNSEAPSDGTFVSSSNSAGPRGLLEMLLCSDDAGSEPTPTSSPLVIPEVPLRENGNMDTSEMLDELSSVPTTEWTAVALTKLILQKEKAQKDLVKYDATSMLLSMFWDGSYKMLACKLKAGWYRDVITDVVEFCSKYVTSDTVILSQAKPSFQKKYKCYHVLKNNEVYSEPPYKSSWLNINEQVDDIDKEFGFPWSLKHRLYMCETVSQTDQDGTATSVPSQCVNDVPKKVLSQMELEPVGSGEERQASTAEATATQASSPKKTECADFSDPYYSFEIQVLPPEEAKMIFEQAQSKMPQSMDMDSQQEKDVNNSLENEPHEVVDPEFKKSVSAVQQVCCLSRWLETIVGPSMLSLSKCQCKKEQSQNDCTNKTLGKEESGAQKYNKVSMIKSDSKFHPGTAGENQMNGGANTDNQPMTFSKADLYNEPSQAIDLTEGDKPENISLSIDDEQLSIIHRSESKADDSSSENEIPNQMADPEEEYVQDQLKFAGSSRSIISDSEVASRMSDPEEDCAPSQLTSTDVAESSLETQEDQTSVRAALQTTLRLSDKHQTIERKRKTPSSHGRVFPSLMKSKKCKPSVDLDSQPEFKGNNCKGFYGIHESEPSATKVRTVDLVLFGSTSREKHILMDSRKNHISSPKSSSHAVSGPPNVLSVNVSSLKRSSVPAIKQGIYKKCKSCFLPTKIRHRRKRKTHKCTSSISVLSLKAETAGSSTNTKELPVSSKRRIWNGNTKQRLSLKRRRASFNGLSPGGKKTKGYVATLKQPVDRDRHDAENGSHSVMPRQDNNFLKFSVLPNTFNLEDGSSGKSETMDPVSDNDFDEEKDKDPNNRVTRAKGTWYSNSAKKCCPSPSPPALNTSSLFQEFQKKYMEKTQPATDK